MFKINQNKFKSRTKKKDSIRKLGEYCKVIVVTIIETIQYLYKNKQTETDLCVQDNLYTQTAFQINEERQIKHKWCSVNWLPILETILILFTHYTANHRFKK